VLATIVGVAGGALGRHGSRWTAGLGTWLRGLPELIRQRPASAPRTWLGRLGQGALGLLTLWMAAHVGFAVLQVMVLLIHPL
jgi:hypothetical protein